MAWYVVRRLGGTVVLLAVIAALTFVLISMAPGDAAVTLAGSSGGDTAYLDLLRHRLGLDLPVYRQVLAYLGNAFRGDFGYSVIQGKPVLAVILGRLPATLLLAGTSLVLASVGGVMLGMLAAVRHNSRLDASISVGILVAYSLPVFWVGQLLVALFGVRLGWLPASGMRSVAESTSGFVSLVDVVRHLVLPASALSLLLVGLVVRTTRVSVIEVLDQDWVRATRGWGISECRMLCFHVLPNALRPVITVVAGNLALVLTGAVLVETVYSWPGLGRLLLDAVLARDNQVLVGLLLFSSFAVSVANLVSDLAYAALDPRVRHR
ncbi:MAG: ABC transporter permease [Acidimicrobiales bacterium]